MTTKELINLTIDEFENMELFEEEDILNELEAKIENAAEKNNDKLFSQLSSQYEDFWQAFDEMLNPDYYKALAKEEALIKEHI